MNKKQPNRLGKLPPRYGFILNPHEGTRVSRCPKCEKLTYPRKFPLVIGLKGAAPIVLGKTCKYCSKCELIIAHKDELDALILAYLGQGDGVPIANEYMVLGTIDLSFWKKSIENPAEFSETLERMADIKNYYDLGYRPAGWYRDEA